MRTILYLGLALPAVAAFAQTATPQATAPAAYVTPQMFGAAGNGIRDDAPALNAAVRAASMGGHVVRIPAGVYLLNAPLLLRSDVTIEGVGTATLRAGPSLPQNSMVMPAHYSATTNNYAQSNVVLRNLTFDGADRALTHDYFLVAIYSTDHVRVENCLFQHHQYGLLAFGGSHDITIAGDKFRDWGKYVPAVSGGPALWIGGNGLNGDETPSAKILATNLDFRDGRWSAINYYGRDGVFRGGTIFNTRENGIYGQGPNHFGTVPDYQASFSLDFSGYTISRIVRMSVAASAIEMGGTGLYIHDNVVSDTADAGIKINWPAKDIRVVHNRVFDTVKGAPTWSTVSTYGQITLLQQNAAQARNNAMQGITIRGNVIGKPGLAPVAPYAIRVATLDAVSHYDRLDIEGNDLRFGGAIGPFSTLGPVFAGGDRVSRVRANVGAPDAVPQGQR